MLKWLRIQRIIAVADVLVLMNELLSRMSSQGAVCAPSAQSPGWGVLEVLSNAVDKIGLKPFQASGEQTLLHRLQAPERREARDTEFAEVSYMYDSSGQCQCARHSFANRYRLCQMSLTFDRLCFPLMSSTMPEEEFHISHAIIMR